LAARLRDRREATRARLKAGKYLVGPQLLYRSSGDSRLAENELKHEDF
jgi:hypothetical protein